MGCYGMLLQDCKKTGFPLELQQYLDNLPIIIIIIIIIMIIIIVIIILIIIMIIKL